MAMFEFIGEEDLDELKLENCENKFVYELLQRIEYLQDEVLDLKREISILKRKSFF